MTAERKKALLYLSLTLVIGILIGALVPAFFGHMRHGGEGRGGDRGGHGRSDMRHEKLSDRRMGFEKMIYKVTKADSVQRKKIQPVLDEAALKIESLEGRSNTRMTEILDSMKMKLKPVLTEEQNKSLDEFAAKAKERHNKKDGNR